MGGKVFTVSRVHGEEPLHVPRISNSLYIAIQDDLTNKLSTKLYFIQIPREIPGKRDHGDVDLIALPRQHGIEYDQTSPSGWKVIKNKEPTPWQVAEVIGATRYHINGPTHSFAIPHPIEEGAHVQVDLNVVGTRRQLLWQTFLNSYGDLTPLLGYIARDSGLTINHQGLHLRIHQVETFNYRDSFVFLTDDPEEVMDFFGLDWFQYVLGFRNEEHAFEWLAQCHLLGPTSFDAEKMLNRDDKQRMKKRPMFARFVSEWFPKNREDILENLDFEDDGVLSKRDKVLYRALEHFNHFKQYADQLHHFNKVKAEKDLWQQISDSIPLSIFDLGDRKQKDRKNLIIRGFKRFVAIENGEPVLRDEPVLGGEDSMNWAEKLQDRDNGTENLLEWVKENWETIQNLEKARVKVAYKSRHNRSPS